MIYDYNARVIVMLNDIEGSEDEVKRVRIVFCLKALDTFGYCRRPVFLLGVSQRMHKMTNL